MKINNSRQIRVVMTEILRELMTTRCVSMHNPSMRCHGKGCDGQCAQFQIALMKLQDHNTKEVRIALNAYDKHEKRNL